MMSGDDGLYDNRVIACMAPLHLDMQIGMAFSKLL
jgi:hypothetical protein